MPMVNERSSGLESERSVWERWHPFLRWPLRSWLVLLLLLSPVFYSGFRSLPFAADPGTLLQENPLHMGTYERLADLSPVEGTLVLNLEADDLFTPQMLLYIEDLSNSLVEAFPVQSIKSLTHAVIPVRRGMRLGLDPLFPRRTLREGDLDEIRAFSTKHPLMRNILVSASGRHTLITVELRPDQELQRPEVLRERLETVLAEVGERHEKKPEIHYLAMPLALEEIVGLAWRDALRFTAWGLGLSLVFLSLVFRSLRILGYLGVSFLSFAVLIYLFLEILGWELSPYSVTLVPILGAIQMALLVHLSWALRQENYRGGSSRQIAARVLGRLAQPCLFAALTSAGALFTFLLAEMAEIRQIGIGGGGGVLIGYLFAFGPGVSFLVGAAAPRKGARVVVGDEAAPVKRKADRWVAAGGRFLRPIPLLVLGIVALLTSLPGLGQLRPDIHLSRFLDQSTETGKMMKIFEEEYGGYTMLRIKIDSGARQGINRLEFLQWLASAEEEIDELEGVSATYSYPLILALLHEIWQEGDRSYRKVPESAVLRRIFVTALQGQREFPLFGLLVEDNWQVTYLYLRSADMSGADYLQQLDNVGEILEREAPDRTTIELEEGLQTVLAAERRITRSQTRSAGLSFLIIGMILWGLWRSWKLALVAVATVAFPLFLLMGWAAYAGILLNASTVLVATLLLGVAVDDIVHLISSWRRARQRGLAGDAALAAAWSSKGPAVFTTTGLLVLLFLLLGGSPFPPVRELGWMLSGGFLLVLLVVILLPGTILGREDTLRIRK